MNTAEAYCETTLNYATGDASVPVDVVIHDGRSAIAELDYEQCGFTLLKHQSHVHDWRDEAHLKAVHVPEIADLARSFSGCDAALVYPPLVRSPETAASHADYAPIESVHSDFTADYRPMIQEPDRAYRAFIDPLLEDAGLSRQQLVNADRVLMLQFWRNIGERYPDRPFALCDASTMPKTDLVSVTVPEYGGQKLEFEAYIGVQPDNPARHLWFTFPGLGIDEVIAFRTYDSLCEREGRPFWTPHSAFLDPNAPAGARPRESLEMRVLCLFGV